jgi:hypothetical protein
MFPKVLIEFIKKTGKVGPISLEPVQSPEAKRVNLDKLSWH